MEILLTRFRFLGVSSKTSTNLEHSNHRKKILDWKEKKLLDLHLVCRRRGGYTT